MQKIICSKSRSHFTPNNKIVILRNTSSNRMTQTLNYWLSRWSCNFIIKLRRCKILQEFQITSESFTRKSKFSYVSNLSWREKASHSSLKLCRKFKMKLHSHLVEGKLFNNMIIQFSKKFNEFNPLVSTYFCIDIDPLWIAKAVYYVEFWLWYRNTLNSSTNT